MRRSPWSACDRASSTEDFGTRLRAGWPWGAGTIGSTMVVPAALAAPAAGGATGHVPDGVRRGMDSINRTADSTTNERSAIMKMTSTAAAIVSGEVRR
ncbi:hypothetical protein ACGFIG_04955 [Micromonospora sp. NPDC049048]|uniref:hypothetical protein n=1 Tax=Micromonospora sp. NPDC049048 TaxID=3364263 RepID=UPI0037231C1D